MANNGDNTWILISSGLVFLMLPGIALFYSGLRSQGTVLSLLLINMMAFSLVTIQWFLFGYSLVFSPTSNNPIIGNLYNSLFLNTMLEDSHPGIPEKDISTLPYALFQGMFAAFTITIITGVIAERGRLVPFLLFTILWTTFGYDPVAYWMWNSKGWGEQWDVLDWAGGTPVHIASGAASFAYTLMLKRIRKTSADESDSHDDTSEEHDTDMPSGSKVRSAESKLIGHNLPYAFLGLLLMWFGWFGFNAGSELKANRRAASTFISTHIAATSGGFAYCLFQRWKSNWSGIGFCTGALAGLVAITPGAGYVPMWSALVFGITASLICHTILFFTATTRRLEEPLDIVVVHGIGGLWGMFLTGIFADQAVAALDGLVIKGGAINHNPMQILYQLAGGLAGFGWSFIVALLILYLIHFSSRYINGLELRTKPRLHSLREMWVDEEEQGDEHPYNFYYAPVDREHKLVPAPATGRHVHAPLPTSVPVPTSTTEPEPEPEPESEPHPDPDPDIISPSTRVYISSKAPALVPVPVSPLEDWMKEPHEGSILMKELKPEKIDKPMDTTMGMYIGLGRGGGGAVDDNAGEGSSGIRTLGGGEPPLGFARGDFGGLGRGEVVHGSEASASSS